MHTSLRTLLAYEDTPFDHPARRDVDRSVSGDSADAQVLERIRRLRESGGVAASSPLAAPIGLRGETELDPNIAAEYIDHTLAESEVAPFESLCKSSDAALAEVAACHEIVSKRLGNEIYVDHLGRLRCYAVAAIPAQSSPATEIRHSATSTTSADSRSGAATTATGFRPRGDVAACLREGKAKNRRLVALAAASVVLLIVAVIVTHKADRAGVSGPAPPPYAPPSLDSFVFDETPLPPPPVLFQATLEPSEPPAEPPAPSVESDAWLFASRSGQGETAESQGTVSNNTDNVADYATDATQAWPFPPPPISSDATPPIPLPPPLPTRRPNPLRPGVSALPPVSHETTPAVAMLADVSSPAVAQTVAWESRETTTPTPREFLTTDELTNAINDMAADSAAEPSDLLAASETVPRARLSLHEEGALPSPPTKVAFASSSIPRTLPAPSAPRGVALATLDGGSDAIVFGSAGPDAPWRRLTSDDTLSANGYVLTAAPFQASLTLASGLQVRLIGDCKVHLNQEENFITLWVDYGRCVLTMPPTATAPASLRIRTERGGGDLTLPLGKSIVFIDTFARIAGRAAFDAPLTDWTSLVRNWNRLVEPARLPREIVIGFLPDERRETVFHWRGDTLPEVTPLHRRGALLLGDTTAQWYDTPIPTWIVAPLSPTTAFLVDAWLATQRDVGSDDLPAILGYLVESGSPDAASLALRLWGDLGHFAAPLAAFRSLESDTAVRAVLAIYFREVLRRDQESIVRLNDAVNEQ